MPRKYSPERGKTTVGDLQATIKYALRLVLNGWDCAETNEAVRVRWTANFPVTQWGEEFLENHGDDFIDVKSETLVGEPTTLQVRFAKIVRLQEIRTETIKAATLAFESSGVVGDVYIVPQGV